jgi:hypothetical protein
MIGKRLFEYIERSRIVEHGELAVRIAGIVAGAEFNGIDAQGFEFCENAIEWQLREQRSKDANLHANSLTARESSWGVHAS